MLGRMREGRGRRRGSGIRWRSRLVRPSWAWVVAVWWWVSVCVKRAAARYTLTLSYFDLRICGDTVEKVRDAMGGGGVDMSCPRKCGVSHLTISSFHITTLLTCIHPC